MSGVAVHPVPLRTGNDVFSGNHCGSQPSRPILVRDDQSVSADAKGRTASREDTCCDDENIRKQCLVVMDIAAADTTARHELGIAATHQRARN